MKKFFLPFFALSILFLSCQISTTSNAEYTVSFDTVGGSDIESQTVPRLRNSGKRFYF